ncbi:MAG TPA: CoA-binding protein, partial [Rhizomicrobium sp.]|nr:CoA-binding protein [Rhizomicrobium sp.]
MTTAHSLRRALLAPESVAVIGASDDPSKTTGRPLNYLRRASWAGRLYPINPSRAEVQGERAWPGVEALPEVPDHALILLPTAGVLGAVEACARAGVKAATILAGGFSEAGNDDLQAAVLKAAGKMRLLGPSSIGYVDPRHGLMLTANAAFAEQGPRNGRLFAASHSGSMIGALASRGAAKGIGFAGLVSVGMEADLTLGEICMAALDDPQVDGFVLFMESLRHAGDIRRFALLAAKAGKPVVAYKLGRSAQAAELAQSHTGAMAGEDIVADAFFRACGIARVDTLDGLLEAPALVRRVIASPARREKPVVGVVATTGGGAAMVVDQLGVRGIEVGAPTPETTARLLEAGVAHQPGRIVDVTLAGTRYAVMKAALDVLTTAPEFDMIVSVAGSSARFHPENAVQPAIDSAASATPLAVFATPEAPNALARLADTGVPAFRTAESCADAVAAAFRRREPKAWDGPLPAATGKTHFLDEAAAYGRLQKIGLDISP